MNKHIQSVSFNLKICTFGVNMTIFVHQNGQTFSVATVEGVNEPSTPAEYDALQRLAENVAKDIGYEWEEI